MTVLNKKYLFSLIKCIDTKNQRIRLEQKEETALYVFCPMKMVSQYRYLLVSKKKFKREHILEQEEEVRLAVCQKKN